MKQYWQILRKYKGNLLISPFLVLITVLCETVQPYFMSEIIDKGILPRDLDVISHIGLYMIVVSAISLIFSVLNIYVSSRTSIGFGTDLRSTLFDKVEQLSFPDIDRFGSASLITRLTNDITKIQQVILMSMRIMLRGPMMLVLAFFFVIRINTDLSIILLATVPILAVSVFLILHKGFPFFIKVQQKTDSLNAVVRENLINIRVVKSFVREDFEKQKFVKCSEELRDISIRASNIVVSVFPVMQFILNIAILGILWFGGIKVTSGTIQIGQLISFVNYLMQVLMALMMLSLVIMTLARASASSKRIVEVLDAEPSLTDTLVGSLDEYRIEKGDIEFKNVCFRYSGGENDVLKNISFHVSPGETVAVVGATGAAKSSMLQLIPRLYDVTEGELLIDGINVKNYNLDHLHKQVGIVLQNNELFTGTIMDNIRWGNPGATLQEVKEAARAAQADEFIDSFTDGYYTMLGRGGVNLSGGQKQRICIARAIIGNPKILILDDSTSAVDTETELKIRNNLARMLRDTTLFVITQRTMIMQSVDRVIVLEDGEIDDMGTPSELLGRSEIYREIYNSQQIV